MSRELRPWEYAIPKKEVARIKAELEEPKWYRSQDLVRRDDAINKVKEYSSNWCGSYEPFDKEEALSILKRIPKAEPKYSGCSYDMFCEKTDCKGCEAEPKENN